MQGVHQGGFNSSIPGGGGSRRHSLGSLCWVPSTGMVAKPEQALCWQSELQAEAAVVASTPAARPNLPGSPSSPPEPGSPASSLTLRCLAGPSLHWPETCPQAWSPHLLPEGALVGSFPVSQSRSLNFPSHHSTSVWLPLNLDRPGGCRVRFPRLGCPPHCTGVPELCPPGGTSANPPAVAQGAHLCKGGRNSPSWPTGATPTPPSSLRRQTGPGGGGTCLCFTAQASGTRGGNQGEGAEFVCQPLAGGWSGDGSICFHTRKRHFTLAQLGVKTATDTKHTPPPPASKLRNYYYAKIGNMHQS